MDRFFFTVLGFGNSVGNTAFHQDVLFSLKLYSVFGKAVFHLNVDAGGEQCREASS